MPIMEIDDQRLTQLDRIVEAALELIEESYEYGAAELPHMINQRLAALEDTLKDYGVYADSTRK